MTATVFRAQKEDVCLFRTLKRLTQYFFDVPSKFLSSPHLVHEVETMVTQHALE